LPVNYQAKVEGGRKETRMKKTARKRPRVHTFGLPCFDPTVFKGPSAIKAAAENKAGIPKERRSKRDPKRKLMRKKIA